jgi:hypothetical protein
MKPTPNLATRRPATMTPIVVDAVSRIQPTEKIKHPIMIVNRRPIKSAMSSAMIAPKKVPAERTDVVND